MNSKDVVEKIEKQNKIERKKGLELLNSSLDIFDRDDSEELLRSVLKCLSDKYERCREISCEIVENLTKTSPDKIQPHLSFIIQILSRRLSVEEEYERSEEVRIRLMLLLTALFQSYSSELNVYAEDVVDIVITVLADKCPDIKKQAAETIVKIAETNKKVLRVKGEGLVAPLARNISHRQASVRAVTVAAVGQLGLVTSGGVFEDMASHMAQRVFDPSPSVRMKHIEVMGAWLMGMPDRYSYFYKLVPLLLVSLCDEMTDLASRAAELWHQAGLQWLEENKMNDARLKDEMDFLTADPDHYPTWIQRPNLGCRTLVARVQHQVYPSIANDLKDWQLETRVKAVTLLYLMLYHSEQDIVMHTEKVLNCLVSAARDEEREVRSWAGKCSTVLGYMLSPDTWSPFMVQRLGEDPSNYQILILAGLVAGTNPDNITLEQVRLLLEKVVDDDVSCTRDEGTLAQLAALTVATIDILNKTLPSTIISAVTNVKDNDNAIIAKLTKDAKNVREEANITEVADEDIAAMDDEKKDDQIILGYLVKLSIAVTSLTSVPDTRDLGQRCLDKLVTAHESVTRSSLLRATLPPLLTGFMDNAATWSPVSAGLEMFRWLVGTCGHVTGYYPRTVVTILTQLCNPGNTDPATRLTSLMILSRLLLNTADTLDSQGAFSPCLVSVVTDIVSPALKWQAGRTAGAIRTAAASSLWSAAVSAAANMDNLQKIFEVVEPRLLGLLADDSERTRMFCLRTLTIIFTSHLETIPDSFLTKAGKEITDTLDDKLQENREECIRCVGSYLHCISNRLDKGKFEDNTKLSKAAHEALAVVTLHMDDDNETFRDIILGCLITLPLNLHKSLAQLLENALKSHRHTKHINTLLMTLK